MISRVSWLGYTLNVTEYVTPSSNVPTSVKFHSTALPFKWASGALWLNKALLTSVVHLYLNWPDLIEPSTWTELLPQVTVQLLLLQVTLYVVLPRVKLLLTTGIEIQYS